MTELDDPFDADEAAADHHHLFGFNVHPYQSYFLDPAGLLGGLVTEGVAQTYSRLGFRPGTTGESVDHIGYELALLSFLCAAEAEALADGRSEFGRQMGDYQLSFMAEHLLPWIGPLTLAVGQQGQGFYEVAARVTLDLASEHAAELAARRNQALENGGKMAPAPDILADEGTGLREIAEFLLTPAYSGIYLGRDDIGRLARRQSIPRGFGDRRQLLLNLFRSAANYDALGDVIGGLQAVVDKWLAGYDEMMTQRGIGLFIIDWRTRADGTAALLGQMHGRMDALE
jgi:TorA maturation chaperone TorD